MVWGLFSHFVCLRAKVKVWTENILKNRIVENWLYFNWVFKTDGDNLKSHVDWKCSFEPDTICSIEKKIQQKPNFQTKLCTYSFGVFAIEETSWHADILCILWNAPFFCVYICVCVCIKIGNALYLYLFKRRWAYSEHCFFATFFHF